MKLPFSYQNQSFNAVLITSLLGHIVLLSGGSFFSPLPQYAVEKAPDSVELVISQTSQAARVKTEPQAYEAIMVAKNFPSEATVTSRLKNKEDNETKTLKKVISPNRRGAVRETKVAYLKNPAPLYPHLAREKGWQGIVILGVLVNSNGKVEKIGVDQSSGYKVLDESALSAVRNWDFLPARVGHWSFSSWIKVPVRFILTDRDKS